MKKKIVSALAIVVTCSTLSANALKVYTIDLISLPGHGTLINCNGIAFSCETLFNTVYYQPCAPQIPVSFEDLEDTFRN